MYYLCTSEEEKALNKRVFSSFFGQKNGIFTSEINFFTLLRKFFLGVCGFFLRHVGGFFGDVEGLDVKRYLFFLAAFFYFWRMGEEERGLERIGEEERGGERNWRFVNACLPFLGSLALTIFPRRQSCRTCRGPR